MEARRRRNGDTFRKVLYAMPIPSKVLVKGKWLLSVKYLSFVHASDMNMERKQALREGGEERGERVREYRLKSEKTPVSFNDGINRFQFRGPAKGGVVILRLGGRIWKLKLLSKFN
ncbi:hypothetical protein TNCV_536591 [Trichonephila clavipes]|nr:hypothetical protein TNCV_536591 [Trichonephila clavipes]